MHIKKRLSFTSLRKQLSERICQIKDPRQQGKVGYSLHDCVMSGFAMMYFQDPSLLEFQRRMEEHGNRNNLRNMFAVEAIPKDTQLRDVLDELASEELEPIFLDCFQQMQRGKHLEAYQFLGGKYLITLDGSGYFSSEKIDCPQCLRKESKKGQTRYHHMILQAAMVHPDRKHVIVLAPEAVRNEDGKDKQDCETNAAKRIIRKIRAAHPKLPIVILADGLYSKQPFIEQCKERSLNFILVAKPDDHKYLMEWIGEQRQLKEVFRLEYDDAKGRRHIYEWVNNMPLNGNEKTLCVNYFEYRLIVNGKVTYHNSWVTDIETSKDNVRDLVRAGRSRWKIENETFNTLKNQGYHLEHNFGHGQKHLSMNFFLLNLLAFFMHQILESTDLLYQKCRAKFSSRREYWNQLRCTFRILIFDSWEGFLQFIISPPLPP